MSRDHPLFSTCSPEEVFFYSYNIIMYIRGFGTHNLPLDDILIPTVLCSKILSKEAMTMRE